jgi:uncharacterized protein
MLTGVKMDNNRLSKRPFRVLSLDGGGMRGLYTASVLSTLSERFSANKDLDIGKGFDLIVGTSTGAILACGIAAGVPTSRLIDMYKTKGALIFKSPPIPKNKFLKILWATYNMWSPANKNDELNKSLFQIFGDETLGVLYNRRKIALCIPSVKVVTHKARVFKTPHISLKNADDNKPIIDVCLASSAAPIIFPLAGIKEQDVVSHFVDGGLWANNPILIGLTESLILSDKDQPIEIISIGTCPPPGGMALTDKEAKRGIVEWGAGIKILELSMDAQASGNQFIASFLADSISELGKKVTILRLKQSAPSSDQEKFLGLDNASEKACSTLIQLGISDAFEIYGEAIKKENNPHSKLKEIFKSVIDNQEEQ